MSRMVVSPEALDFDAPGRRDYAVKLEHTTIWGHHLIPVTVLVGRDAKPGRGLLAIGSTHGDEMEGPIAIKHLVREIDVEAVAGRIVLVPVLNVMAFRAHRRETPDDGVNLNRAFPGDAGGSVTFRLADFVTRFLFPAVHVCIDIHAGGQTTRFPAVTSFHAVKDRAQRLAMEEAARGFGTKFVMVYQNLTAGLLTSLAENLGKITVGTEMGWGGAVQAGGVSMSRQGVLAAAIRHGQLRGEPPPNRHHLAADQVMVDSSDPACNILASFEGHFEPTVELGEKVARGRRVGWLHDFNRIDEAPSELVAPHDGYIICQAWNAPVVQGQVLTQIGKPIEWSQ